MLGWVGSDEGKERRGRRSGKGKRGRDEEGTSAWCCVAVRCGCCCVCRSVVLLLRLCCDRCVDGVHMLQQSLPFFNSQSESYTRTQCRYADTQTSCTHTHIYIHIYMHIHIHTTSQPVAAQASLRHLPSVMFRLCVAVWCVLTFLSWQHLSVLLVVFSHIDVQLASEAAHRHALLKTQLEHEHKHKHNRSNRRQRHKP